MPSIEQALIAAAERFALLAPGGRQAQKREPLKVQKSLKNRGAYQPSSARLVGRAQVP